MARGPKGREEFDEGEKDSGEQTEGRRRVAAVSAGAGRTARRGARCLPGKNLTQRWPGASAPGILEQRFQGAPRERASVSERRGRRRPAFFVRAKGRKRRWFTSVTTVARLTCASSSSA